MRQKRNLSMHTKITTSSQGLFYHFIHVDIHLLPISCQLFHHLIVSQMRFFFLFSDAKLLKGFEKLLMMTMKWDCGEREMKESPQWFAITYFFLSFATQEKNSWPMEAHFLQSVSLRNIQTYTKKCERSKKRISPQIGFEPGS